jgi:dual specificity phosphatase 12
MTSYSSANEVLTGLWLGNIIDSGNKKFLKNIDVIINCSKDIPFSVSYTNNIRIPIEDDLQKSEMVTLYKLLPEITRKIHDYLSNNKKILVHCYAGKQRSAALIVAYCIRYLGLSLNDAVILLKTRRKIVFTPFLNFKSSLVLFEKNYAK